MGRIFGVGSSLCAINILGYFCSKEGSGENTVTFKAFHLEKMIIC